MFFIEKHILERSIAYFYFMRNFNHNGRLERAIRSKPVLILLGILILIFSWSTLRFWNKMRETAQNKELVESKVAELEKQKEKLTNDINSLKTSDGKEKVFRDSFGLAKDGEEVIVIVDDKNAQKASEEDSKGFFSFLKNWFK